MKKILKPYVCINMASSIDGKIATKARGPVKLGSDYDSRRMKEIRAEADAIVMGKETFLAYPKPLLVNSPKLSRERKKRGYSREPATVLISSKLQIPENTEWENATGIRRIVFCSDKVAKATRERLEKKGVEFILSRAERISPKFVAQKLFSLGLPRILLEGGGNLNASFFEAGVVDRIYLTLCPVLVGGCDSPTIFDGEGFPLRLRQQWRLVVVEKKNQELYLVYDRGKA